MGAHDRRSDRYRILMVEGNLGGGYENGLETAVSLAEQLHFEHNLPVDLMVVGKVSPKLATTWQSRIKVPLVFSGLVERERIPQLDRSAHLLYAADINAACPNSVIEALACGLPVLAFDTGALPELVTGDAGRIVGYGGNPWRLDPPDIVTLAQAAVEVLENQRLFRDSARELAKEAFGLDTMVEGYLKALVES
jgi:glycosyltransferase involved in cell wall biosynthesis